MKIKSTHFIYLIVLWFILMIISAYYFNKSFFLCIWTDNTCTNIPIPNLWWFFVSLFSIIITVFIWFWRHYILKEKDDEINKKTETIKSQKSIIKEKENFAGSIYAYLVNHSPINTDFVKWELWKINKNIIVEELVKTKEDIKEKSNTVSENNLLPNSN